MPRPGERRRRVLPSERVIPPPGWLGTWFPHDKHAVVAAVRIGQISLSEARSRYMLSLDEFAEWFDAYRDGPAMKPMMAEHRILLGEVHQWLTRGV